MAAGRSGVEGALNVSTGRETSLLELAAALGIETEPGPGAAGEIRRSCLDPSAAAERLGWTARTPLGEGLARTLEWLAGPSRSARVDVVDEAAHRRPCAG